MDVLLEFPSGPILSAFPRLDAFPFQSWSGYSRIHFHVKLPLRPSSFDRFTSTPCGFLRTDLHSSKPCFVPTRCSSDDASRPHQQPLIHLFVSLALRDRKSNRIPIHQTCTKARHMEFQEILEWTSAVGSHCEP